VKEAKRRIWPWRGALATVILVPLLLWLSGCWLFNVAPIASFTVSRLVIEVGTTVSLSAILSSDEDGIIVKFEWDFGDGSSGSGEAVTHTYGDAGTYTVVLRVTDDDGETATAQKTLTVNPAADGDGAGTGGGPTASFTATPITGAAPLTVTFNASASAYSGHAITAYFWDFGDGTTGTGITTTHTYAPTTTRSYNVVLRIIASDNTEDTSTKTVTATVAAATPGDNDPTASFTTDPNKVTAPQEITANGENSSAVTGRTLKEWIWRFGDGTASQSRMNDDPVGHRYVTDRASETFTITLIVVDDEDGTDTEQRTVVVENKQPVAGFEIYDLATATSPPAGGDWLADDVTFPDAADPDIQTDSATIWIRSEAPTTWVGALATPNDGSQDDPDPRTTGEPGNYGDANPGANTDHDLCYDPEGQDWDGAAGEIPFGWPNAGWGIEWYKINWGDGNTQYVAYDGGFDPGNGDGLRQPHLYTGLADGANTKIITVTAIDYLGGETAFSREITINADFVP